MTLGKRHDLARWTHTIPFQTFHTTWHPTKTWQILPITYPSVDDYFALNFQLYIPYRKYVTWRNRARWHIHESASSINSYIINVWLMKFLYSLVKSSHCSVRVELDILNVYIEFWYGFIELKLYYYSYYILSLCW